MILITNDDGILAPGLRALVDVASNIDEVLVVAPDSPQSGKGHAITIESPIKLRKVNPFGKNIESYECSGTPVDCVKLAKSVLLKGRKIDLCISGINHGLNASINIIYSGTMSAAMEASLENIQSIGFSLDSHSYDADFSTSSIVAQKIIESVLETGIKDTLLLNVNIPNVPYNQIKGIKVCRQADGHWEEEFQVGEDPRGEKYYWLKGKFIIKDRDTANDINYIKDNFVTIVPSGHDLTIYPAIIPNKYLENLI